MPKFKDNETWPKFTDSYKKACTVVFRTHPFTFLTEFSYERQVIAGRPILKILLLMD